MTLKNQWQTLKENWLIIIGLLLIILILNNNPLSQNQLTNKLGLPAEGYGEESIARDSLYYPGINDDFAPNIQDRKITKTIYESIKIKRGNFDNTINSLKNKISDYDTIVLNENIYSNGEGLSKRKTAQYSIKVKEENYKQFVSELNSLGEIESFTESSQDVTGEYLSLEEQIKTETQRLNRYKEILSSASSTQEKIEITDRIFDQERTIKFLEESLKNKDNRIDYVTISLTLTEKESNFAGSLFISLKDLIRTFISSLNNLITLFIYLLPWIIIIWIIRLGLRRIS